MALADIYMRKKVTLLTWSYRDNSSWGITRAYINNTNEDFRRIEEDLRLVNDDESGSKEYKLMHVDLF